MVYTNRFGRTSYPMRAYARYLRANGPSSVRAVIEGAKLGNGKKVKDSHFSMEPRQLTSIFRMHPDFSYVNSDSPKLWKIDPKTVLLQPLKKSQRRRKDRLLGKEA